MTKEQIFLTIFTVVLIPAIIAEVRYRIRLSSRLLQMESLLGFLQTYLLKNAVLEFHSPDPRHKRTDDIIEKLVEGKELEAREVTELVDKIKTEAVESDDKKRRLQAQQALWLVDKFLDEVQRKAAPTAIADFDES